MSHPPISPRVKGISPPLLQLPPSLVFFYRTTNTSNLAPYTGASISIWHFTRRSREACPVQMRGADSPPRTFVHYSVLAAHLVVGNVIRKRWSLASRHRGLAPTPPTGVGTTSPFLLHGVDWIRIFLELFVLHIQSLRQRACALEKFQGSPLSKIQGSLEPSGACEKPILTMISSYHAPALPIASARMRFNIHFLSYNLVEDSVMLGHRLRKQASLAATKSKAHYFRVLHRVPTQSPSIYASVSPPASRKKLLVR